MSANAEELRLTQFVTDATENALNEAMKLAAQANTVDAGVLVYCTRAVCFELAGVRAQLALLRNETSSIGNEVAEVSAEISHLRG